MSSGANHALPHLPLRQWVLRADAAALLPVTRCRPQGASKPAGSSGHRQADGRYLSGIPEVVHAHAAIMLPDASGEGLRRKV